MMARIRILLAVVGLVVVAVAVPVVRVFVPLLAPEPEPELALAAAVITVPVDPDPGTVVAAAVVDPAVGPAVAAVVFDLLAAGAGQTCWYRQRPFRLIAYYSTRVLFADPVGSSRRQWLTERGTRHQCVVVPAGLLWRGRTG
ncbi:MAG: hypothetical protein J3R72DRAFT_463363 [Linnemannia gamsii]|nr:MAG: hypothetical protein J3R72DRAFT_463363 [Linnemannia gamsii]